MLFGDASENEELAMGQNLRYLYRVDDHLTVVLQKGFCQGVTRVLTHSREVYSVVW